MIHSAENCRACKRCISACPFHAPKLNPKTNRADKCNFCVERIDQGLRPVCVENCITGALNMIIVKPDELKSFTFKKADVPIAGYTNPSVFINQEREGTNFSKRRMIAEMKGSFQELLLYIPLNQLTFLTPFPKELIYYDNISEYIPDG